MGVDMPRQQKLGETERFKLRIMTRLEKENDAADDDGSRQIEREPPVRRVLEHADERGNRIGPGNGLEHLLFSHRNSRVTGSVFANLAFGGGAFTSTACSSSA